MRLCTYNKKIIFKSFPNKAVLPVGDQGDQIGRIFTYCVVVYFGQLLENYIQKYPTFLYFIPHLSLHMNFGKNGLGYILGDFFTNSSGHSVGD
jgi:phosphatidate phosphatase APP1